MKESLRTRRACAGVAQDALHPDHRFGVAAAGIANKPAPFARLQYGAERRECGEGPAVERDLPHDRVALGDLAQRTAISSDLGNQGRKLLGRQEVRAEHKAVPVERRSVLLRDAAAKLAAVRLCKRIS